MNDHTYIIPINPDNPHGLGRHVHHDLRNANFRALVQPPARSPIPYRTWSRTVMFDQGNSPSCTMHAAVGLARTTPYAATFTDRPKLDTEDELRAAYEESKDYDPWIGRDYDGTSSDAPYRWMRDKGYIKEWRWLFGEPEVREWVTWYGPCTVGTIWTDAMFHPDEHHYIVMGGGIAGGHEYELCYYSPKRDAYRLVNSWGYSWGDSGRAWLRSSDLARLLEQDGDAVTIGT